MPQKLKDKTVAFSATAWLIDRVMLGYTVILPYPPYKQELWHFNSIYRPQVPERDLTHAPHPYYYCDSNIFRLRQDLQPYRIIKRGLRRAQWVKCYSCCSNRPQPLTTFCEKTFIWTQSVCTIVYLSIDLYVHFLHHLVHDGVCNIILIIKKNVLIT